MAIKYDYAKSCTGGPASGTRALGKLIEATFPGCSANQIYNCRSVRGGTTKSLHGEGRAVDAFPASKAQGDQVAEWARQNAQRYQIQEVIWNRKIWSSLHASAGWRNYGGSNPHTDHIHIGQNRQGAKMAITGAPAVYSAGVVPASGNSTFWTILLISAMGYVGWKLYEE